MWFHLLAQWRDHATYTFFWPTLYMWSLIIPCYPIRLILKLTSPFYLHRNILGIIDGTHVAIQLLEEKEEAAYVNRKGFHRLVNFIMDSQSCKNVPCLEIPAPVQPDKVICQCTAQSANFWKFWLNSLNLVPFLLLNPAVHVSVFQFLSVQFLLVVSAC